MTDPDGVARFIRDVVGRLGTGRDRLPTLLRRIQHEYSFLPRRAMEELSGATGLRAADIESVASFYPEFRLSPAGRHTVNVCVGTACFVKGADQIFDAFKSTLGISASDDTDADRLFTVRTVACLGCCMLAPVVQIDDRIYGHVGRQDVSAVLEDFLTHAQSAGVGPRRGGRSQVRDGWVGVCTCTSCAAAGSQEIFAAAEDVVSSLGAPVDVIHTGCSGASYAAPEMVVSCGGKRRVYTNVGVPNVERILGRTFGVGSPAARAKQAAARLLSELSDGAGLGQRGGAQPFADVDAAREEAQPFHSRQIRIVTEGAETIDPYDIDDYIRGGGFEALRICCSQTAAEVLGTVAESGLRGRGGGGYETARKWARVKDAPGGPSYVLCNADEGDPGAFMDRMILESHPFRVLEGMTIGALTIGAEEGVVYVRAEYPRAVDRLQYAIDQARAAGFLGSDIRGSGRRFDVRVEEGAGAFVCGEETAMLAALEGRRPAPASRPPYPSERGYRGAPTVVNNVETFATVPWIIRHGSSAFRDLGTANSPGTKCFALAGKVRRGGLVEVPMGITIREIVDEVGGGVADGRALKAVQIGGPSGGCIPASLADTPIDFEALERLGAMMGSGGLVVLDETDCMVDVARYFMQFTQAESCGTCPACRIGTKRMLEILTRLCEGKANDGDVERLERLAVEVRDGSLCGLGRTAPNPVLSTLKYFRDEYAAHVRGACPAGKCRALVEYRIRDTCIGCTRCSQACPADAIEFRPHARHEIDHDKCVRCGTCAQVCPVGAVEVIS